MAERVGVLDACSLGSFYVVDGYIDVLIWLF